MAKIPTLAEMMGNKTVGETGTVQPVVTAPPTTPVTAPPVIRKQATKIKVSLRDNPPKVYELSEEIYDENKACQQYMKDFGIQRTENAFSFEYME